MVSHPGLALARFWGVAFWVYLLAHSAATLGKRAFALTSMDLTSEQIAALVAVVLFFVLCAFKAMTVWAAVLILRADALGREANCCHYVASPFYVGGFYRAKCSRMVKAYGLVVFIAIISVVVAHMPTPWREITDGGVVLNLVVGVSALLWFSFSAWALGKPPSRWASADFPEDVSLIVSGQKPAPSVVQTKDACETYPSVAQDPQPVAAV